MAGMNLISRSVNILRNDGPIEFLYAVCRFIYYNLNIRTAYLKIRHQISGNKSVVSINKSTATMQTRTFSEYKRFYDLMGEEGILSDVLMEISSDDVFYDIGANVGLYSCMVGVAASDCDVLCFEPHPNNMRSLKENMEENSLTAEYFSLALANENSTLKLSSDNAEAGFGRHSLDTKDSSSTVAVDVRQLDSLRSDNKLPIPTVVKIDVEGAELEVIKGALDTFSNSRCRVIYCEVHPERMKSFGGNYDELRDCLRNLGFEIEIIDGNVGKYSMIKATK